MKRIVLAFAVCIMSCILLTACGGSGQSSAASSESSSLPQIKLGETVTVGDYEFTVSNPHWTGLISEKVSETTTISFEAVANGGDIMLVFDCDFTNNSDSDYLSYAMNATVETSDGTLLPGGGWSPVGTIPAGSSGHIYLYVLASNADRDAFKSGVVTLNVRACTMEDGKAKVGSDVIGEYQFEISAQDIAAE